VPQTIQCPQCGKLYKMPDNCAGRKAKCKACGNTMTIPAVDPIAKPQNDLWDELLVSQAAPPKPAPRVEVETGVNTRTPNISVSTKRRRAAAWPAKKSPNASTAAIVLLICSGLLFYYWQRESRLATLAKEVPQQLTLRDLMTRGPGDNIHIVLSNFRLLLDRGVVKSRNASRTYAWIPAIPSDAQEQPGTNSIKVLVGTSDCGDDRRLAQFCFRTSIQGMIVNSTDSLDSKERKVLNETLQGVDIASCYLFRADDHPCSSHTQSLLLGFGCATLLAGSLLGGFLWLRRGQSGS
jgi:hypothetical protein